MVNLELYRVFYTVAKRGSLTKAAEELFISQPAVSQAIKQLEIQLGGPLFIRTHNGMQLSDNGGKQIFPNVEKALALLEEAENKYAELKESATGSLRICASDTVSTHFLLAHLKEFHEKYPSVNLSLHNRTSAETIDALKSGKADIGFINLPVDDSEISLTDNIMPLHDTFVCAERFAELAQERVPLKKLQEYPLLMLELSTATRQAIVNFAHSIGVHLHPEIELASLELMCATAKQGMGVACIPREFVKKELDSGELLEVHTDPELPARAIGLALPKTGATTFAVREFIKMIKEK